MAGPGRSGRYGGKTGQVREIKRQDRTGQRDILAGQDRSEIYSSRTEQVREV